KNWVSLLATGRSSSQGVVIQETSRTTNPGETITLTCGSSAGAVTTSNYLDWFQQKPNQVPRGLIGDNTYGNPNVPERFSGSLRAGKAVLTITGAQPEDEAFYYCALWSTDHCHSDRAQ
uniref:Ig-like domain-containing protein n=1 Tax=Theropithecus gelada TaxID=9565 RepID=A0A8D2E3P5_THEGE